MWVFDSKVSKQNYLKKQCLSFKKTQNHTMFLSRLSTKVKILSIQLKNLHVRALKVIHNSGASAALNFSISTTQIGDIFFTVKEAKLHRLSVPRNSPFRCRWCAGKISWTVHPWQTFSAVLIDVNPCLRPSWKYLPGANAPAYFSGTLAATKRRVSQHWLQEGHLQL